MYHSSNLLVNSGILSCSTSFPFMSVAFVNASITAVGGSSSMVPWHCTIVVCESASLVSFDSHSVTDQEV